MASLIGHGQGRPPVAPTPPASLQAPDPTAAEMWAYARHLGIGQQPIHFNRTSYQREPIVLLTRTYHPINQLDPSILFQLAAT
jgi:hypothetical protein